MTLHVHAQAVTRVALLLAMRTRKQLAFVALLVDAKDFGVFQPDKRRGALVVMAGDAPYFGCV